MLRRSARLAAALGLLAACRPAPPPPDAPDAGTATRAPGSSAGPASAATPGTTPGSSPPADSVPYPLPVQAFALEGATELPLDQAAEPTEVDPHSAFRIESGVALTDAHAVLLDDKGDMVPSTGTSELGQAAAQFRLAPREPLRAGSRYTLKVESADGKELRDAQGHVYMGAAVALRTTGTKPAAPATAKKKRHAHR